MIQSKFKNMYLRGDKPTPYASTYYFGTDFDIKWGELRAMDINGYEQIFQIVDNKLVIQPAPQLSPENFQLLQTERMLETPASESKVVLPVIKSQWYYEPAGDDCVYIVCPYEPFVGLCLTVTNRADDNSFLVELAPKKHDFNDDQKWRFVMSPKN